MASIQNITFEDQGVNWRIGFQYSEDNGVSIPWTLFEANIPSDLNDIPQDELEGVMWEVAMAVARGQGHTIPDPRP